jgi:fluoride exporter
MRQSNVVERGVRMDQLTFFLLVATGGAIGAVLRCLVGTYVTNPGGIPWNTFIVNFVGCFLMAALLFSMSSVPAEIRSFLFIGLFGAFTTMSSFSVETLELYTSGMTGLAVVNFVINTFICVGGAAVGRIVAISLAS